MERGKVVGQVEQGREDVSAGVQLLAGWQPLQLPDRDKNRYIHLLDPVSENGSVAGHRMLTTGGNRLQWVAMGSSGPVYCDCMVQR
jgi:hypothetical protein